MTADELAALNALQQAALIALVRIAAEQAEQDTDAAEAA